MGFAKGSSLLVHLPELSHSYSCHSFCLNLMNIDILFKDMRNSLAASQFLSLLPSAIPPELVTQTCFDLYFVNEVVSFDPVNKYSCH